MAFNLRNRHFLKIADFTPAELGYLLRLAADLKRAKYAGTETQTLKGKNIGARSGRGSDLSGPFGIADRQEGIDGRHGARAGANI